MCPEWSDMSTGRMLFQLASTIKIQLSMFLRGSAQSLVFCVVFCRSSFVLFLLATFVLSIFPRLMASNYLW